MEEPALRVVGVAACSGKLPSVVSCPLKVTEKNQQWQQLCLTDADPAQLFPTVLHKNTQSICFLGQRRTAAVRPLEAGVDSGRDRTFVERIAVLWENIAHYKENSGSPITVP